jgi:hypothetical protein
LANNSATILSGVTLTLKNQGGATNFTETDLCGLGAVPSQGEPFTFNPGQTCSVKVTFAPVETSSLTATLMIGVPSSNAIITVPIIGAASAQAASTSPFDFAVRNASEASVQFLMFSEPLRTFHAANLWPGR